MMNVMGLGGEVGDGQLQAMHPELGLLVGRHQVQAWSQVLEDIGDMGDDVVACLEKGWREGRTPGLVSFQIGLHGRHAKPLVFRRIADIEIVRAGFFERQSDEFAATLDAGPVVQFVTHGNLRRLPDLRIQES